VISSVRKTRAECARLDSVRVERRNASAAERNKQKILFQSLDEYFATTSPEKQAELVELFKALTPLQKAEFILGIKRLGYNRVVLNEGQKNVINALLLKLPELAWPDGESKRDFVADILLASSLEPDHLRAVLDRFDEGEQMRCLTTMMYQFLESGAISSPPKTLLKATYPARYTQIFALFFQHIPQLLQSDHITYALTLGELFMQPEDYRQLLANQLKTLPPAKVAALLHHLLNNYRSLEPESLRNKTLTALSLQKIPMPGQLLLSLFPQMVDGDVTRYHAIVEAFLVSFPRETEDQQKYFFSTQAAFIQGGVGDFQLAVALFKFAAKVKMPLDPLLSRVGQWRVEDRVNLLCAIPWNVAVCILGTDRRALLTHYLTTTRDTAPKDGFIAFAYFPEEMAQIAVDVAKTESQRARFAALFTKLSSAPSFLQAQARCRAELQDIAGALLKSRVQNENAKALLALLPGSPSQQKQGSPKQEAKA
jgi:hypothetical protein